MMMFDLGPVFAMGATAEGGSPFVQAIPFVLILAIVLFRGKAIGRVFETSGAAVDDVPVTRVPASLRASRFVRHNRLWVAAGALLIVGALTIGALGSRRHRAMCDQGGKRGR